MEVDKENLDLMRDNRSVCRNNIKPFISTDIGHKPIRGVRLVPWVVVSSLLV